jgi:hypothetical protein
MTVKVKTYYYKIGQAARETCWLTLCAHSRVLFAHIVESHSLSEYSCESNRLHNTSLGTSTRRDRFICFSIQKKSESEAPTSTWLLFQVNPNALAVRDIDESHVRSEGSMSRIVDSKGEAFYCDRSHPDGDFCMIQGDIRIDSKSSTIVMYAVSALPFSCICCRRRTLLGDTRILQRLRLRDRECVR